MKKVIQTKDAPAPVGPYNQAILAGETLYVSGQIAIDPKTGAIVNENIKAETHQVMQNLKNILSAANASFEHVVKCSVFVTDMHLYNRINAVYAEYFNEDTAPARELVDVCNLPKFVNVEISLIACISQNI